MYGLTQISIIISTLVVVYAKVYGRCELARELRNFDISEDELPTWVCIAQHESNYNTSAMNPGSGDHGLFQISQIYWCSPPGSGFGCNSPCSKFRDDDIADDLQCIRRIYNEHKRISGNGFDAWVVYSQHCNGDTSRYILGCFDEKPPDFPSNATENEIPEEEDYSDGYQFPPLPSFSKSKHEEDVSQDSNFGDGYEFPKLPFSRVSIHDSLSLKDSTSNFNFPFSKQSIHHFIPEPAENPSIFEKKEEIYDFPSLPIYSKQSIHHFIPVIKTSKDKENGVEEQRDKTISEYDFPPLPIISKKPSIYPEIKYSNEIGYNQEDITELTESTKSPTIKQFKFSSKLSTILPYKTIQRISFPSKLATTTLPQQKSTSLSKQHVFSLPTVPTTTNPPFVTTTKSFTKTFKTIPIRLTSEDSKDSTFSLKPFIFTTKAPTTPESVTKTTTKVFSIPTASTTTNRPSVPTTKSFTKPFKTFPIKIKSEELKYSTFSLKPFIFTTKAPTTIESATKRTTKKSFTFSHLPVTFTTPLPNKTSAFSFKPFVTNFKPTKAKLPFVNDILSNNDLQGSSSTRTPLNADFKPVTTLFKSLNSLKPFVSTFKQLTTQKTPIPTYNKPILLTSPVVYHKTTKNLPLQTDSTTFKPYASYTTDASEKPTPTSSPSAKQLTFAPDSFFSWIFGSQTLPPIVPPVPPSRRPSGERPGLPPRPSLSDRPRPERPGSLPRPPIFNRPGRPMSENIAQPKPDRRPSDLPKPFGTEKWPFTRRQLFGQRLGGSTASLVSITTPISTSRNVISSKSPYQGFPSATTPLPKVSGRSGIDNDHKEVKVMLDKNFVFIRTKFGYRLFRNT